MDFEVVWTQPAVSQFEDAISYVAERSPPAAEKIASALVDKVELLRTVPYMGSVYAKAPSGRVRFVVSGKYRVFYRVNDDAKKVEILTVWHSSRQDPELPLE